MTTQESAYTEIERLVKSFKDMPAAQRKGLTEILSAYPLESWIQYEVHPLSDVFQILDG